MKAEDYWNQILGRLGATNETIYNWQADLSLEPEFAEAMSLATPEKRAEYDCIYQTCLYNLMLQQECDGRKMELAKSYRDCWADRGLFDRKHLIEEDMDEFQKAHARKKVRPSAFVSIPFHVIGLLIYLLLGFLILGFAVTSPFLSGQGIEGAQVAVLIFGCLVAVPHGLISIVLFLTFSPIFDAIYSSLQLISWLVFFIAGCMMFSDRTGGVFTVLFFLIGYPLSFIIIPLIFMVIHRIVTKRGGGILRRLTPEERETYHEYLSDYSDVINRLNDSFALQLNLIQADCEARKHHPEAALYNNIPQYYEEFCAANEADFQAFAGVIHTRGK